MGVFERLRDQFRLEATDDGIEVDPGRGDAGCPDLGNGLGADVFRQVVEFDFSGTGEHRQPFRQILELTDVARPVVIHHSLHGFVADGLDSRTAFLARDVEKMMYQQWKILDPIAQRRNLDRQHVQAVVEVFSKATLFDQVGQVLMGRRDDANVDFPGLGRADRFEAAFLKHA